MSHHVKCDTEEREIRSVICSPTGSFLTNGEVCDLVNQLQDDCLTLKGALQNIRDERNDFRGPSIDYMQGYRDGQQHLQTLAKLALSSITG